MKRIKLAEIDYNKTKETIKEFVVDKVLEFNSTGCVMGLSGGVDSTLVATLVKESFDDYNSNPEHLNRLELKSYILPSNINESQDTNYGVLVAQQLGIDYEIIEIEPIVSVYDSKIDRLKSSKYDRGNLQSRIRANILHTKGALENKLVVGTGNRDEDFGLGYYTLFGDGAVHLSPIGDLSKRHVKEMVRRYGFLDIANREPTAALEKNQTDFSDLGYTYEFAELIVEGLAQGFGIQELSQSSQVKESAQDFIKKSKFNYEVDMIKDIVKRHSLAKKKAELLSPPICELEKKYI